MLSVVKSATVIGLEALPVLVEVDISLGLPAFNIVGLPDAAIREARERVRSSIVNSEYEFPLRRITVNLAPGDIKKEGSSFDLPIALGILAAAGFVDEGRLSDYLIAGELSLTGDVKRIAGALSIAARAKKTKVKGVVLPVSNAGEAALIEGIEVIPTSHLRQAVDFFNGIADIESVPHNARELLEALPDYGMDFSEVKGHGFVKRGLEIAAAGGHNVLMVGPPGSGKTMMARRLPTIMPALSFNEAVEITRIYSVAGMLPHDESLVRCRPFRAPHHTISKAGLIGGGSIPRPGEVSLSHRGVLFLDEFPEFGKNVLEVLRQPLEDRFVTISRAALSLSYPADFMLIASMNPCPCGFLGDRLKPCACAPGQVQRYRSKISGPLLDRIDIQVEVKRLSKEELMATDQGEASASIRARVETARERQRRRFANSTTPCNASMKPREVRKHCRLGPAAASLLEKAIDSLALSGRSYERILKVARTIADLSGSESIEVEHIAEATQYRMGDAEVLA